MLGFRGICLQVQLILVRFSVSGQALHFGLDVLANRFGCLGLVQRNDILEPFSRL